MLGRRSVVHVIPFAIEWLEGFQAALDSVAREKHYLLMTEGPSLSRCRDFVEKSLRTNSPIMIACTNKSAKTGQLIGWCDIRRAENPALRHTGTLAIGMVKKFRGQGWGQKLLTDCLQSAWQVGMLKVELTVYCRNSAAIRLYRSAGFREEGLAQKYAFVDGQYLDALRMAIFNPAEQVKAIPRSGQRL